jgi:DNA polymerase-1
VRALGWPLLMVEGVEADDVIGTLARQAEQRGMNVIVSTGDKDLAQLVTERVTLVNTMTNETLDRAGVIAKFGVPPERIIDYLALIGDTVDNVPGVEKCGPKTAVKWLTNTAARRRDRARRRDQGRGRREPAQRARLPAARPQARHRRDRLRSRTASRIDRGVAEDRRRSTRPAARHLRALRLQDMAARGRQRTAGGGGADARDGEPAPVVSTDIVREYETIQTWAQFDAWLAKIDAAALTAFDTETTSLDPMTARLVGMSFSVEPGKAAYLPVAHRGPDLPEQLPLDDVLARLKPWLEAADRKKVGQHLKYDAQVLANYGIALNGIEHDTLLESYVLESHRTHDMDSLALRHLGVKTIKYEDVAARARSRSASTRWRSTRPPRTRPKTPTSRCSCITCSIRRSHAKRASSACIARSRCRCRWCCARWSAPAC